MILVVVSFFPHLPAFVSTQHRREFGSPVSNAGILSIGSILIVIYTMHSYCYIHYAFLLLYTLCILIVIYTMHSYCYIHYAFLLLYTLCILIVIYTMHSYCYIHYAFLLLYTLCILIVIYTMHHINVFSHNATYMQRFLLLTGYSSRNMMVILSSRFMTS